MEESCVIGGGRKEGRERGRGGGGKDVEDEMGTSRA